MSFIDTLEATGYILKVLEARIPIRACLRRLKELVPVKGGIHGRSMFNYNLVINNLVRGLMLKKL